MGWVFWSGYYRKSFISAWVGLSLNSFSSIHGQSPKQALRLVQGLICISTNVHRVEKKLFSPAHGLFFYLATYP